jgi:hypothetical protein
MIKHYLFFVQVHPENRFVQVMRFFPLSASLIAKVCFAGPILFSGKRALGSHGMSLRT